ncbi:unnamed protein product, partial [Rotaria sp. Silwood2]
MHEEIGAGAFGIVHRATWKTTRYIVAVKKLHLTHLTGKMEKEFFKELSLLNNIRCPNIISFYGACTEAGKYAMVMEYMSLGSLYKLLHEDNIVLTWSERLAIAFQTTSGINYLHQLPEPILHRDIKSLNFLIERAHKGYIVKVCDFGLARTRNETTRQTKANSLVICTLQWTAPEILCAERYTDKSDIYSLGIVYWELGTGEIPYDDLQDGVIRAFVLAGDRLKIPNTIPSSFRSLIQQCWVQQPNDRPNSSHIIEMIEECIKIERTSLVQSGTKFGGSGGGFFDDSSMESFTHSHYLRGMISRRDKIPLEWCQFLYSSPDNPRKILESKLRGTRRATDIAKSFLLAENEKINKVQVILNSEKLYVNDVLRSVLL